MRRLLIALALGAAAIAGTGCAGRGTVVYSASADYSAPSLAYVSPGVYAVEGVDEPIFYSDNAYWRLHGGIWYRSNYWDRDYVYYSAPPRAVVTIDRPYAYVRFHAGNRYHARRDTRYAPGGTVVRDHRYRY